MPERILLIDGNNLVHRAFHALPPLTTSRGELTNATYGFTSMLIKSLADLRPDYVAAAFDTPAPTYRHLEFEAYKAQRGPAPEGLYEQFDRVQEILDVLRIPTFRYDGYEADDLLGTLARQAREKGIEAVILTSDIDALQLVAPGVTVLASRRGITDLIIYDEGAVKDRFGIEPSQIPDFKALRGDASDNIPGIPGIGDKTAGKLLAEMGSLEGVARNLDSLPAKTRAQVEPYLDRATFSRHLAQIQTDAPVTLELEKGKALDIDREKTVQLFQELEFRSLLERLGALVGGLGTPAARALQEAPGKDAGAAPGSSVQLTLFAGEPTSPGLPAAVTIASTPEEIEALAQDLAGAESFGMEVVSDGQPPMRAEILGLAIVLPTGSFFVPAPSFSDRARAGPALRQVQVDKAAAPLRSALRRGTAAAAVSDSKGALVVLSRHGVPMGSADFDPLLAAYLLENAPRALTIEDLAQRRLSVALPPGAGLTAVGPGGSPAREAELAGYACARAEVALRLRVAMLPELQEKGLWDLFREVEMPLVAVLAQMEQHGIALDVPYLMEYSRELYQRLEALEVQVFQIVGHRFNLNSSQQLSKVLFEELKLPGARKTRTGMGSTGAEVLEELRGLHPVIEPILEHRQLVKLKSTYVDALPLLVHPDTGRVHTSFNQMVAATGRLSSSDPNLQNIPIRTEEGRRVRRAFLSGGADNVLLSADYSQIELRVQADLSQDPRLLAAFAEGEDVHAATAAEVFAVASAEVTPDMRRVAKVINFGIMYGLGDYGLATRTGLSQAQARDFIRQYYEKYGGIRAYQEQIIRQAQATGYVTTLLGRRRYIPEINATHQGVRRAAQRVAVNTPIQGTAADIIKVAMVNLHRELQARSLESKMLLQVHDELLFEVPRAELEEMKALAREIMEQAVPLSVPVVVDLKAGPNWGDMA